LISYGNADFWMRFQLGHGAKDGVEELTTEPGPLLFIPFNGS
jgi:hypothetical protein